MAAAALGPGMGSANADGPARAGRVMVAAAALGQGTGSAIAVGTATGPQERASYCDQYGSAPGNGTSRCCRSGSGPGERLRARGWDEPKTHNSCRPEDGTSHIRIRLWARGWDEPMKHKALGPRAGRATEGRCLKPFASARAQLREVSCRRQRDVCSPRTHERPTSCSRLKPPCHYRIKPPLARRPRKPQSPEAA